MMNLSLDLLGQQQQYPMAWALVIMFVLLGMLAVCFPRRRKVFKKPKPVRIRHNRPALNKTQAGARPVRRQP